MTTLVRNTYGMVSGLLASQGRAVVFLFRILLSLPSALARPRLVAQQVYGSGVLSLAIIVISGAFVGMVLALQGYRLLVRFGAEESLGLSVAFAVIRELGPVLTALLLAGRAGSALAAEIGLMRATDQLSGMEMMAVDPIKRVVAPRFLGLFIAMPLLSAIFTVMSIGVAGGHLIGVELLGVDAGSYWSQIQSAVTGRDILDSMIKSLVFGAVVAWIAMYQGYHAPPTSEGVSRATTSTVVLSSLSILGLDFVLTAVMFPA
jgi:phospholipid/cholesterol/gamma-HCH transport system permease protein